MGNLPRVVVCTDFTTGSDAAVERGLRLAQEHHAALDLLHAFDAGMLRRLGAVFDARRLTGDVPPDVRLCEQLTLAAKRLGERSGLAVQPCFGVGEPAAALESHVRQHHPAVAVLAHRADPGTPGVGSTLMRVLRGVSCPILVVRARAEPAGPCAAYQRVLCALDLREVATRAAATALGLFPRAAHRLVTVVDPRWERALWPQGEAAAEVARPPLRDEADRRLQALAAQLPRSADSMLAAEVHDGVPARVLVEQAAAWPADCIVVGRHGQGVLAERWLGSTTLDLIHHGACDVLVVS